MWHQDILAWQYVRESLVQAAAPGRSVVQLCVQDPTRVILTMTRTNLAAAWYSTARPTDSGQGILVGNDIIASQATPPPAAPHAVGTIDPVTGGFTLIQLLAVQEYVYPVGNPGFLRFRWPDDGVLCKLAWYAFDPTGIAPFWIQEVLMDRNPCGEHLPTSSTNEVASEWSIPRPNRNRPFRGGRHFKHAAAWRVSDSD